MIYQRELPVKYTADVCVIGGGPTGVAAAIAAAMCAQKAQTSRQISVSELQDRLVDLGAFLPNHK